MKKLTPIKLINKALVLVAICIAVLFVLRLYIFGAIGTILLVGLGIIWYRLLGEELVIHYLQSNGGIVESAKLNEKFSEKVGAALSRLQNKGIIRVQGDSVELTNHNYISIFSGKFKAD